MPRGAPSASFVVVRVTETGAATETNQGMERDRHGAIRAAAEGSRVSRRRPIDSRDVGMREGP
ncbi:hypothetical protein FHR81_002747 [Actinoalloteichus hoggarensis]|uniref:Uncharacterized protein n=1 Tax=Actinoalloteichus hoggarensis TaxID=1470176 RepID=A0A221VXW0_9PSEU|nr:hypothetical protein AHOG_03430 [Actinoalloteichus hoggarensis]MBB5921707.1 hypothetical protein [Actinoalloteichus hoggarensis]